MRILKCENQKIFIELPLTAQSGKIRVKTRNNLYEYGIPTATRQIPFSQKHYIEWQIGYDIDIKDETKLALTSLNQSQFIGYNGKTKALYELSEYLFYFVKLKLISIKEIDELLFFLKNIKNSDFLDASFGILRTHPIERKILDINFYCSEVKYPLLIYKFDDFDILIEIIIKEKQRAIGVQPMLYVCFPITKLNQFNNNILLGRTATKKEYAILTLDIKDKSFLLDTFKIFGILSPSHNYDIRKILEFIKSKILK